MKPLILIVLILSTLFSGVANAFMLCCYEADKGVFASEQVFQEASCHSEGKYKPQLQLVAEPEFDYQDGSTQPFDCECEGCTTSASALSMLTDQVFAGHIQSSDAVILPAKSLITSIYYPPIS